jgi:branched-chain amino acid transport system permease protein
MNRTLSGVSYVSRLAPWVVFALLAGYLATTQLGEYNTFTVGTIAVACVASIGLNLLIGNAGLISLATPAFMAIGAYGAAIVLQHTTLGIAGAVILPILASVILGGLVGLLALRLKGFYLALATLGLLEAIQYFLLEGGTLVGSGYGYAMPTATIDGAVLTFQDWSGIAVGVVVLAVGAAWSIRRSAIGRALTLLRENELVAGCMGINTIQLKIGAFALSAGFGALAGVLSGFVEGAVSPNVFSLTLGVSQLAFIIFGGLGYVSGALVGTAFLMALPVWFTSLGTNEGILYAAVLLVVVVVAPRGMVAVGIDTFRMLRRRIRHGALGSSDVPERSRWSPVGDLVTKLTPPALRTVSSTARSTNQVEPDTTLVDIAAIAALAPTERPIDAANAQSAELISFHGATVRYGGLVAVNDMTMSVKKGSVHGLIGPNGAGKSSAVAALFGLVRLTAGTISVEGELLQSTAKRRSPWTVAQRGLGRTFQTPAAGRGLSVLESVENGVFWHLRTGYIRAGLRTPRVIRDERQARESALEALELVRYGSNIKKPVSELTLGELRRVELARVLAARPRVIVLDEPTSGLELADADGLFSLLQELAQGNDRSVLVVEHNVRLIFEYCDDITVLNLGQVIANGPPTDVAEHVAVKEAYLGHR